MRQTFIVALLSAVVLGDDWLTNPTTDKVRAALEYKWTPTIIGPDGEEVEPITDEERAKLRKDKEDASIDTIMGLRGTVESLSESLSLQIHYDKDVLKTGTSGKSDMTVEWEVSFGQDNKLKKSVFYDENVTNSKFSVGICWKSEMEAAEPGDVDATFDWDCQMQYLRFVKGSGDQVIITPIASGWTLSDN